MSTLSDVVDLAVKAGLDKDKVVKDLEDELVGRLRKRLAADYKQQIEDKHSDNEVFKLGFRKGYKDGFSHGYNDCLDTHCK